MSAKQQLTPEELQALLAASPASGTAGGPGRRRVHHPLSADEDVRVDPYDLQTTLTLTQRQRAVLHQWGEQLSQTLRYELAPALRMSLDMRLNSDELATLSTVVAQWQEEAYVSAFTAIGSLRGEHFWAISRDLGLTVIDRLLGGPGTIAALDRGLSRLEIGLLHSLAARLCSAFHRVLAENDAEFETRFAVQSVLTTPEQMNILSDSSPVYIYLYEAQLGEVGGKVWLCIRADALKSIEETPAAKAAPTPERLREHRLAQLDLPLRVLLPTGAISLQEIEHLATGDVIVLNGFRGEPVSVVWNDKPVFRASPAVRDGQMVVQVVAVETSPEQGDAK